MRAGAAPGAALHSAASRGDVDATVAALRVAFEAKGIRVFAVIDHAGAAREAGLAMPPTKVIVFGNPKGGTPLMLAHPSLALDLPMRVLVRETAPGRAEVLWHAPSDMERGQGLPAGTLDGLKPLGALVRETVDALGR
ncbi:DUF302 domain-containing protein [Lysobacter pythonis]|uniref:DUF302 domain-containing protein n=2 Tax=Solilutibacter pythonis TaxID=2483112 RepID=A0A3M2HS34_9GAMM|nr:DUF302 domain-containing protein [Lysobacter pythonis]